MKFESLQNLFRHQEAPTMVSPIANHNVPNLYAIPQNMKPIPSFLAQIPLPQRQSQQQNLDAVYGNEFIRMKQSQKITENVHAVPLVRLILPEPSYKLNGEINSNEASEKRHIYMRNIKMCVQI